MRGVVNVLFVVPTERRLQALIDAVAADAERRRERPGNWFKPSWPLWAGYGPYWWYDPFWPGATFIHGRAIAIRGGIHHVGVGHFHGHWSAGGHGVARGGRHR